MKKILFISVLFLAIFKIQGQILSDSTAQVVGWWNIGETETYLIVQESFHLTDGEVSNRQFYRYAVTITIIDYTDDYYLINWHYHDFEVYTDDDFLMYTMLKIMENMTVTIRTCVLGSFQEIVNWEEVRDFSVNAFNIMRQETRTQPDLKETLEFLDSFFEQFQNLFSTREVIEANHRDIQLFYYFHGLQYNLGEKIIANTQLLNMFGGEPLDAVMTFELVAIYAEDYFFVMRMQQETNPEQLAHATLERIANLTEISIRPFIERNELTEDDLRVALEEVANTDVKVSQNLQIVSVVCNSGWILSASQTRETVSGDTTKVEKITIDLLP